MKKVLSLAITLCLLISSLSAALIVPVSAATGTDYYELASNYYSYVSGNTIDGEAGGTAPVVDDTEAHTEGGSSIKFKTMHSRVAAVKLNNIEIGKTYKLSAWFKGTPITNSGRDTLSYDIRTPGIYAPGTAVGENGALTNAVSSLDTINKIEDTDWHEISIVFTATSTDLYFAINIWCGSTIWLDDITLTDIYYELASNYYSYPSNSTIGSETGFVTPTVDSTVAHTEGGSSIKFKTMHSRVAAVKLNNIEIGKTYKLNLWFKGEPTTTRETPSYDVTPGIYAPGAAIDGNGNVSDAVSSLAAINKITDTDWHEITIVFTATSTDLYFAMRSWLGSTIWLDDITLTDVYYELASNYYSYPSNSTIGSETGFVTPTVDSTVAHTEGGSSIKFKTMHSRVAAVKLNNIEIGKTYKLNLWFKGEPTTTRETPSYDVTPGIYAPGAAIDGNGNVSDAVSSLAAINKITDTDWHEITIVFTATSTDSYFAMRSWLGSTIWLDDITLKELTPKTITFETNGGNKIESISSNEGTDIVMPENPTKDGYAFAGWYTDANLTNRFTATTFPAEDITLYAKWVKGFSYQDFENYTATHSSTLEVLTDDSGNGYLKYSATDAASGSFVVSDEALKDFATPGDQIKISLKYKLLSGDAKFYMITSSLNNRVNLTKTETGAWLNPYKYKEVGLTVSEEWQELTATYDLKSYSEIAAGGFTFDDFLYTVLIFSSENGAELYIDDITLDVIPGIKVKTAYNNASALRSAEASSTGKNGLRIYNEIDTHWVAAQNIVEYGSVAAYDSKLDGVLTINSEVAVKGIAYSVADDINLIWEATDDTVVFTSYLTNIAESKYNENILIRSYAIAADGTVYYGRTVSVSVFEVANAIDNANTADGSEPTEEDSNAFYTFVTEANSVKYAEWCTDNGKKVGTLYTAKYSA